MQTTRHANVELKHYQALAIPCVLHSGCANHLQGLSLISLALYTYGVNQLMPLS